MEGCFICRAPLSSATDISIRRLRGERQTPLLEKQIEVYFLITKLMEIPLEVCTDFISANGNPSTWISYCKKCSLLLKEYRKNYDKLLKYQNAFNLAKEQLKHCMKTANSLSTEDSHIEKVDVKCVSECILNLFLNLSKGEVSTRRENSTKASLKHYENDGEQILPVKEENEEYLSSGIEDMDNNVDDFDSHSNPEILPNTSTASSETEEDFSKGEIHFKCEYCAMDFKYKTTKMCHVRRFHTKEPTSACEKCGEWFPDRKDVLKHFAIAHPNEIPKKRKRRIINNSTPEEFKCEYCKMDFKHKTTMDVHIRRFHTKEPTHACEKCGEWFPDRKDVLKHFAIAHPNETPKKRKRRKILNDPLEEFKCEYCKMEFKHKTTMLCHIRRFHTKILTCACEKCGEKFPDRRDVLKHFAIAHPDDTPKMKRRRRKINDPLEVFKCEYCKMNFKYKTTMLCHVRRFHTKEPTHACEKCGEWFPDRKDVLKHFEIAHPNEIPKKRNRRIISDQLEEFKCEYCGIDFKHKNSMNIHIRRFHTKEPTCECEKCGEWFPDRKDVLAHFAIAHPGETPKKRKRKILNTFDPTEKFTCQYCSADFKHRPTLMRHIRRIHTKEPTHACEKCGEWFPDRKDVLKHFAIAHPDETPKKRAVRHRRKLKECKVIVCEICGGNFKGDWAYKNHMRTHTGDKPHLCELCSERFFSVTLLSWHKQYVHYKELDLQPFQCNECGKFLCNPPALKYHMIAHHGEKDVKCDICGAGFVNKHKLKDHIKLQHEKQKNFECKDCGEKLSRKRQLEEHRQKHSGIYDHVCAICQKGFPFIAFLKRHMKYHSSDFPHKRKSRLLKNVNVTD